MNYIHTTLHILHICKTKGTYSLVAFDLLCYVCLGHYVEVKIVSRPLILKDYEIFTIRDELDLGNSWRIEG